MSRTFEVCKNYNKEEIKLPTRATKYSAGYDFMAAQDIEIPSFWKNLLPSGKRKEKTLGIAIEYKNKVLDQSNECKTDFKTVLEKVLIMLKPILVPTGIKASMNSDEYLMLCNRSSNPLKKLLLLGNGVGIVDADYYSNPSNDGEIKFLFWNFGIFNLVIKKGDYIGQGIFQKYLLIDNDKPRCIERTGGFGSTNN